MDHVVAVDMLLHPFVFMPGEMNHVVFVQKRRGETTQWTVPTPGFVIVGLTRQHVINRAQDR